MKIKDKKTGEIITLELIAKGEVLIPHEVKTINGKPITLKLLSENYEDAPEPAKGYFYIRDGGNIDYMNNECSITERHKAIGNYFETAEEAKRAVEKLKAWKRLKDKGWRFLAASCDEEHGITDIRLQSESDPMILIGDDKDIQLLFGGEDE